MMKSGEKTLSTKHGHALRKKNTICRDRKTRHSFSEYQNYSLDKIMRAGVHTHPTLIINGKAVYGSLSAENAFNAVCEAF